MLKSNGGEPWRTSKRLVHTAEVAGWIGHRPTSRVLFLQYFSTTEDRNLHRCSVRAQQRSDAPTSSVRNANEPRIGADLRVAFSLLSPEGADQGNGNERWQDTRVK